MDVTTSDITPDPAVDAAGALALTEHEILALAGMAESAASERTVALMGISRIAGPELLQAGHTTLLARGNAELEGTTMLPVGKARVFAQIMAAATEWIVYTIDGSDVSAIAFLIQAPPGAVLVGISPVGVHEVRPIDLGVDVVQMCRNLTDGYVASPTITKPVVVRIRRITEAGETAARLEIDSPTEWKQPVSMLLAHTGPPEQVWPHVVETLTQDPPAQR